MSYMCDIEIKADKKTLERLAKPMEGLKEANIEVHESKLLGSFAEDCTEVIFNTAKAHSLTLSYEFEGEEGFRACSKWENGVETDSDEWEEED